MPTLTPGANTVLPSSTVIMTLDYQLNRGTLDITAYLLCAQTGKVRGDDDMIFYGQKQTKNGAITLTTATGKSTLHVNTAAIDADIGRIAVCATLDGAPNISALQQLHCRWESDGQTVAQATLTDTKNRREAALILAELYRHGEQWKCRWVVQGFNGGLQPLAEHFGIEIAEADKSSEVATPPSPPTAPAVNLSKITLDKHNHSVNLTKQSDGFGKISVNLNWHRAVVDNARKGGLLGNLFGHKNKGIDLDLGAMIRLKDGSIHLVQALGNTFGSLTQRPYVKLDGDDRTGDQNNGEWLHINGAHWQELSLVVIYCFIYEGVANWAETDGIVSINVPKQPPIEVHLTEGRKNMGMCAIATLSNEQDNIKVKRIVEYFPSHCELDERFGFGFLWKAGRK